MRSHGPSVFIALLALTACDRGAEESGGSAPSMSVASVRVVLEIERDERLATQSAARAALQGRPLLWDGEVVGELGRVGLTDFGAQFQATPRVGRPSTFAVRIATPCGPRDLPIATWDLPASRAGDLSFSDTHEISFAALTVRQVYVAGGDASQTIHVGELELPGGAGTHVVLAADCEEASVRVGTEEIGTWRSSGPTFVNLDPAVCHRYEVRTFSLSGYEHDDDATRILRGRSAETLAPSGDPHAPIDHYMERLPSTISRDVREAHARALSGIWPVDCAAEEPAGEPAAAAEPPATPTTGARRTSGPRVGAPPRPELPPGM
jgi:hypothetical protein